MANKIHTFYNARCINCLRIEKEMRRVGSVTFCPFCCDDIFKTNDPVRKERKIYLKFLKIQSDRALKEVEH
jgi:hypothetical protein